MFNIFIHHNSWIHYMASSSRPRYWYPLRYVYRVVLGHATSRSLLVWYSPPGLTIRTCIPGVDEVYIRTPPTPPSTLAFSFSIRSSSLFSPRLAPDSDLPTSTSLQDPRLLVDVSIIFISFSSSSIQSKHRTRPHGTSELTETPVREGKVSKLCLYIPDQFKCFHSP